VSKIKTLVVQLVQLLPLVCMVRIHFPAWARISNVLGLPSILSSSFRLRLLGVLLALHLQWNMSTLASQFRQVVSHLTEHCVKISCLCVSSDCIHNFCLVLTLSIVLSFLKLYFVSGLCAYWADHIFNINIWCPV